MNYKVIEKNEFGIRVRNYSEMSDCNLCKNVAEKNICNRIECAPNSYYLPDSEVEKLESELTPETFTINDMYVEAKLLFDCQDQLRDLQIENKQLKESIAELQAKNEELIKFLQDNIDCCKIPKDHKDPVDTATYSMYIAYKNVLEFIKN